MACKRIKARKYAFGADEISAGVQGLTALSNIAKGITGGGNSTVQSVFTGLNGVGDAVYAANPIAGLAVKGVGAIGSAIKSIIGTKGSVNETTGEITYGTGIKGRRNRNNLKQQSGRIINGITAARNSANYAADWYMKNGYNDFTMAANGGIIPTTLAYLDDGELVRTPDGDISEIPERGKPTDSNLVNVPVGSQVLSDKLKVPGENKTFAEKGKEIMSLKKSKGKDRFAKNSDMLNERNAQQAYDALLEMQENMKKRRSIKKNKTNSFAIGTEEIMPEPIVTSEQRQEMPSYYVTVNPNYNPSIVHSKTRDSWYNWDNNGAYEQAARYVGNFLDNESNLQQAQKVLGNLPQIVKNTSKGMSFRDAVIKNIQDHNYGQVHDYFSIKPFANNTDDNRAGSKPVEQRKISFATKADPMSGELPAIPRTNISKSNNNYDLLTDLIGDAAGLIGPLSNLSARGESVVPYTYTPKYGPTEYNIEPLLREINRSNAMSRYNMANINPNTGANMAYGLQSAVNRDRAIASAYAQKNNAENQMAMQNANIYNQWAQFDTNARHTAAVENAQNRAALDNTRRRGISQLGTALQTMSKDKRQTARDKAILQFMKPFLGYGAETNMLNEVYKKLGIWQ